MIFSEFSHAEVVNFLKIHEMFSMSIDERTQILWEAGKVEEGDFESAKDQKFNEYLINCAGYSYLLKNSYLEGLLGEIIDVKIKISDHLDESIIGIPCAACELLVFETEEDSFFEICPVCKWQNDGAQANVYSGANRSTIIDHKNTEDFNRSVGMGKQMYVVKI